MTAPSCADNPVATESPSPSHLAPLPGGCWALWRWVGLRSAGFPAGLVRRLAAPECAAQADRLLQATDDLLQAQAQALHTIDAALDALRADGQWDDQGRRLPLLDARRQLKKGRVPDALGPDEAAALHEAGRRREQADAAFRQSIASAAGATSRSIAEVARDERFREALIWQNRQAFLTGVEALGRVNGPAARGSKRRQHEELVAGYLQRYCVKNDTIGFFGPVGWACLTPDGPPVSAQPGPGLVTNRHVRFEQWAIDALAETFAGDKWMRPWLAPRRLPHVYLSGTALYLPSKPPAQLSPGHAAALQACDGIQPAKTIAGLLSRSYAFEFENETAVYRLLEQLCAAGLIVWTLEVPFAAVPEQALRRALERVGDRRLRAPALATLDSFEAARAAVAAAAGDADRLNQALEALETTFTGATGSPPTRSAGATYAARTLVYEDCRRDVDVTIGPAILNELGPPLSLLLHSARWCLFEVAGSYQSALWELYGELVQQARSPVVEAPIFWREIQTRLLGKRPGLADRLLDRFQDRWAEVLALPTDQRQVAYSSAALRPRVLAAFDAPGPGWHAERYHCPDIMIAASSAAAISRGDYQLVMGELHLGSNTLQNSFFIEQHPAPEELFQALERDIPKPRVLPFTPRHWPEMTSRTRPGFATAKDIRLAFGNDAYEASERVLPIGALVVERAGDGIVLRTRDGRHTFDALDIFAEILAIEVVDCFKLIRPREHVPRITIDRLVICREAWRWAPGALPFAFEAQQADRFLAARRWARMHGLPRHAFVKVPVERKPFFVDFDSPILVDLLARAVRRTAQQRPADAGVVLTEMLPALDQLWLADADDRRYTSELRFVALDRS